MTPEHKAEIHRRAIQDAAAMRSGWPVRCPYATLEEHLEWQKQFDLIVASWKVGK